MLTIVRCFIACIGVTAVFWMHGALAAPSDGGSTFRGLGASIGGILVDKSIWELYQRRFIRSDGRVVDTGNGGATHSEGQGYGMLIAIAASDRLAFEKIWVWTKTNLATRKDHLVSWKRDNEAVNANNASDGDLLIAWALAEAADLWDDASHLAEARDLARDLYKKLVWTHAPYGPFLMPGASGFSVENQADGPVVNLSYWVFPAFGRLARLTPELDWEGVARSGLSLIDASHFGPASTPTDWVSLAGEAPVPALGFDKVLGYNAIRIPLYLVWSGAGAKERLRAFAQAWPAVAEGVALVDSDSGRPTELLREPGYRAIAALARCAVSNTPYEDGFYRFTSNQNYYPATLHILSLFAAANAGGPCLDHAALRRLVDITLKPNVREFANRFPSPSPARPAPEATRVQKSAFEPEQIHVIEDPLVETRDARTAGRLEIVLAGVAVVGFLALLRRRALRASLPKDVEEESIENAVTVISSLAPHGPYAVVPRTLPENVFSDHADIAALEGQIELAAQACKRLSRTIGLIYFELPADAQGEAQQERASQETPVPVQELRGALRATDHVAHLGGGRLLICICLLDNLTDLESISRRLAAVIRRHGLEPFEAPLSAGLAIYPLNGYSGADLMDAARRDLHRDRAANSPAPATPVLLRR